jgi:hypothetical protein
MLPRLSVILACLTLVGCQAAPVPEVLVPVKGKVTVKGKPLGMGTIVFHPDREKGNTSKQEPRGTISSDGTYELDSSDDAGAPPGAYKVTIYAMKNEGSTKPPTWLAHQKFTDVKTSGLTAEVTAEAASKSFDFDVTAP